MIALTKKEARDAKRAVERALREGLAPPGVRVPHGARGAIAEAAARLGINSETLRHRVSADGPAARLGYPVDWSLGKARPATPPEADPIEIRRLRDQLSRANARAAAAEKRALADGAIRERVFGLASEQLAPQHWPPPRAGRDRNADAEAMILVLSDVHMGEVIDLAQMGGRNAYNQTIAKARLRRYFETVVKLATVHWSGPPPSVIYLALMGDLVSGEIHEELAKTNDLLAIPAVREITSALVSAIDMLLASFACDIRVLSVPGNHGRLTRKPEAKAFALNSYDTLVAWALEHHFSARGEKRVSFQAPASGDALVNIHGWNILFTHGDRIGSRGGAGFIGPAATAARGMQRILQDYAAEGVVVDSVIIGHFHTPLELEQGFVNGSLAGPSEYSRSGRMRSHPASQWMLTVHPRRGFARRWKIACGDPSEGSIYRGRESAA